MKVSLAGAAAVAVIAGCSHTSSSTINSASDMAADSGMAMADAGMSSMGSTADAGMSSMSGAASGMGSSMGSMTDAGMSGMNSAGNSAMTAADQAKSSAGSLAGSAGTMAADAADAGMSAASSAAGSAASATALTDAQIAGITAAAHKGEIDAARMARKQSKNAKVRAFAAQMIKQHTGAQKMETDVAGKAGITPAESDMSAKLTQGSADTAAQLKDLKGKEFDKAYVKAQVDAHTKVLDTLDNVLIPAAQNPALKAQLQKERPVVAEHLEHAKKLADSMGAQ